MKKRKFTLLALVLALSMLLTGCFGLFDNGVLRFSDMKYLHPNMATVQQSFEAAQIATERCDSVADVIKHFNGFYGQYQAFTTSYYLSFIHYTKDTSDIYWQDEYEFCTENLTQVSAWYDQLLYAMADCALREELEQNELFGEGFFDAFEGESIYDEEMTALMEQEAQLTNRYYDLSSGAIDYTEQWFSTTGTQLEEVFVELIALRQQIARHAGYDDYAAFAYDCYHLRDYTPSQAAAYCQAIGEQLLPLYRQATQQRLWETVGTEFCTEKQALDYLSEASKAMGGQIWECYRTMVNCELYDISIRDNKYAGSYELYLYSYGVPFLFTNPYGMMEDKLSLTHEFGHFCNDYASYGSTAGTDVSEVFSQGLEYLSLFYVKDSGALEQLKLLDCLDTYVTQAAYASFEHQVYSLEGEDLTAENVRALYSAIAEAYGLTTDGFDGREYTMIAHFYTHPMYIISYILSNDASLQLYQLESAQSGSGLDVYASQLATQQPLFLEFLKEAGLQSPFEEGRLPSVRKLLEEKLFS